MEVKSITSAFDNFSLSQCHRRFLCGGSALREARAVSRMQLYLALINIDTCDNASKPLVYDMNNYEECRNFLLEKKQITLGDLTKAHAKLTPCFKYSGKIRHLNSWIGRSKDAATYIPPPPEKIEILLHEFLKDLNTQSKFTAESIINFYCRFLTIHPFLDGNGRMSRVLIEYMQKKSDLKIHFSLYRIGISISKYQDAVLSFGIRSNEGVGSPYWQEMLKWTSSYEEKSKILVQELKSKFTSRLALTPLARGELEIIALLLAQPVLTFNFTLQCTQLDKSTTQQALTKLVALGILKPFKMQSALNVEVLVCREVFDFMIRLDKLLFEDKAMSNH